MSLFFEERIRPLIRSQTFPPFSIVVSPNEAELRNLAEELAIAMLCESGGCQSCAVCERIRKHQSESVLWIGPQNGQIRVDQTRAILEFLSLQSVAAVRFVVLEQSETLNVQASNQLLKVLEEPPPGTYFVLLRKSTSALMPTLRSRAIILRLPREERSIPNQHSKQTDGILRGEISTELRNELKDRLFARDLVQELMRDLHERAIRRRESTEDLFFHLLKMERELRAQRDPVLLFEEFSIHLKRAH